MAHKYSEEDSELIDQLYELAKKNRKLVRSSLHDAPADPNIKVRSWKMSEFKYYQIPSPFPTLARGIFTVDMPPESGVKHRIVARGYDKFFNIGEVPWTTWSSLESHTSAPYTLSLKSNGCIIFIAALTQDKLLVTSKHAIGSVKDEGEEEDKPTRSHAEAGEQWLRKYLFQKKRTEADLAKVLWDKNWTAVAELCDDNFEEHVLRIPPELTGLHLHGINVATKRFDTLPQAEVDAFADEWGFIKTLSTAVDTIAEVREFTNEVSKTGIWQGQPVEGFVVRTHVTEPPTKGKADPSVSPYEPGSSFFFKVKFDEPYMMYRDWREVTKSLLTAQKKGDMSAKGVPKSKMRRAETRVYVEWAMREIKRNPKAFEQYHLNKGIIATRDMFLEWLKTPEGKKALAQEKGRRASSPMPEAKGGEASGATKKPFGKTIIVPVAIPGCGKTAVAVALQHIFGFSHTQSDDVAGKKAAPVFVKNVLNLLKKHDVVIADKNNHLKQHRQQLRDAVAQMDPPVRLLALNWSLDKPNATIHRICGDRVQARGENHQTLRADNTKSHEDVIWMFINNTQELTDSEVDAVVDMDMADPMEDAIKRAVDGVVRVLGLPAPSPEKLQEGIAAALGYKPKVKKAAEPKLEKAKAKAQDKPPRYFGLLAEVNLKQALGEAFDAQPKQAEFWRELHDGSRVTARPHVTIVHSKSLPAEGELWERCRALHELPVPPLFRFTVRHVIWNGRVMALPVEDLVLEEETGQAQEGADFVAKLNHEARDKLHVTVGTRGSNVAPVEAKDMVEKWRKGDKKVSVLDLKEPLVVKGRIKGMWN
ncbi:RNA ligase-domain-containing protein [Schizophyllum amplum]|uniref:tRNA ligase n=1 Tax=Schizophyllum amplum TaxID=97359 RepID=A0A550CBT0_9AGAR|nr:RNA ligase-domain-containing protein [Auriculariopsis ampla]